MRPPPRLCSGFTSYCGKRSNVRDSQEGRGPARKSDRAMNSPIASALGLSCDFESRPSATSELPDTRLNAALNVYVPPLWFRPGAAFASRPQPLRREQETPQLLVVRAGPVGLPAALCAARRGLLRKSAF